MYQFFGKCLFIVDVFCGVNVDMCFFVCFIMEVVWQVYFVKNMFICLMDEELVGFKFDFIVMNGVKCINLQWKE